MTEPRSRFHNLSNSALADEIGRADADAIAADTELKGLKAEFRARGLADVTGRSFRVRASTSPSVRLDTRAVRAHLGEEAWRFEIETSNTYFRVRRIKPT